jgi:hypothetical protein
MRNLYFNMHDSSRQIVRIVRYPLGKDEKLSSGPILSKPKTSVQKTEYFFRLNFNNYGKLLGQRIRIHGAKTRLSEHWMVHSSDKKIYLA